MRDYFVFIGTCTNGHTTQAGIYTFRFSLSDGSLTLMDSTSGIDNPTFLAVSPDNRYLYSVSEVFEVEDEPGGGVMAYSIVSQTGQLNYLNSQSSHGACPCHLMIDRTAQYVMSTNYMGGNIAILSIHKNGLLNPAVDIVQHKGCSNIHPDRQEGPHPHSITISPDNKYAIAADLGNDMLMIYKFDRKCGRLISVEENHIQVGPGQGPRHFDFHPNGQFGFLVNELGNTVVTFRYYAKNGSLEKIDSISTLPSDYEGENIAADIHVHPNGNFLYASNRGHDSLVIYAIDDVDGKLEVIGYQSTKGEHPRNFCIDPTGSYLLVANRDSNNINVFSINSETGLLSLSKQVAHIPEPVCIRFMSTQH